MEQQVVSAKDKVQAAMDAAFAMDAKKPGMKFTKSEMQHVKCHAKDPNNCRFHKTGIYAGLTDADAFTKELGDCSMQEIEDYINEAMESKGFGDHHVTVTPYGESGDSFTATIADPDDDFQALGALVDCLPDNCVNLQENKNDPANYHFKVPGFADVEHQDEATGAHPDENPEEQDGVEVPKDGEENPAGPEEKEDSYDVPKDATGSEFKDKDLENDDEALTGCLTAGIEAAGGATMHPTIGGYQDGTLTWKGVTGLDPDEAENAMTGALKAAGYADASVLYNSDDDIYEITLGMKEDEGEDGWMNENDHAAQDILADAVENAGLSYENPEWDKDDGKLFCSLESVKDKDQADSLALAIEDDLHKNGYTTASVQAHEADGGAFTFVLSGCTKGGDATGNEGTGGEFDKNDHAAQEIIADVIEANGAKYENPEWDKKEDGTLTLSAANWSEDVEHCPGEELLEAALKMHGFPDAKVFYNSDDDQWEITLGKKVDSSEGESGAGNGYLPDGYEEMATGDVLQQTTAKILDEVSGASDDVECNETSANHYEITLGDVGSDDTDAVVSMLQEALGSDWTVGSDHAGKIEAVVTAGGKIGASGGQGKSDYGAVHESVSAYLSGKTADDDNLDAKMKACEDLTALTGLTVEPGNVTDDVLKSAQSLLADIQSCDLNGDSAGVEELTGKLKDLFKDGGATGGGLHPDAQAWLDLNQDSNVKNIMKEAGVDEETAKKALAESLGEIDPDNLEYDADTGSINPETYDQVMEHAKEKAKEAAAAGAKGSSSEGNGAAAGAAGQQQEDEDAYSLNPDCDLSDFLDNAPGLMEKYGDAEGVKDAHDKLQTAYGHYQKVNESIEGMQELVDSGAIPQGVMNQLHDAANAHASECDKHMAAMQGAIKAHKEKLAAEAKAKADAEAAAQQGAGGPKLKAGAEIIGDSGIKDDDGAAWEKHAAELKDYAHEEFMNAGEDDHEDAMMALFKAAKKIGQKGATKENVQALKDAKAAAAKFYQEEAGASQPNGSGNGSAAAAGSSPLDAQLPTGSADVKAHAESVADWADKQIDGTQFHSKEYPALLGLFKASMKLAANPDDAAAKEAFGKAKDAVKEAMQAAGGSGSDFTDVNGNKLTLPEGIPFSTKMYFKNHPEESSITDDDGNTWTKDANGVVTKSGPKGTSLGSGQADEHGLTKSDYAAYKSASTKAHAAKGGKKGLGLGIGSPEELQNLLNSVKNGGQFSENYVKSLLNHGAGTKFHDALSKAYGDWQQKNGSGNQGAGGTSDLDFNKVLTATTGASKHSLLGVKMDNVYTIGNTDDDAGVQIELNAMGTSKDANKIASAINSKYGNAKAIVGNSGVHFTVSVYPKAAGGASNGALGDGKAHAESVAGLTHQFVDPSSKSQFAESKDMLESFAKEAGIQAGVDDLAKAFEATNMSYVGGTKGSNLAYAKFKDAFVKNLGKLAGGATPPSAKAIKHLMGAAYEAKPDGQGNFWVQYTDEALSGGVSNAWAKEMEPTKFGDMDKADFKANFPLFDSTWAQKPDGSWGIKMTPKQLGGSGKGGKAIPGELTGGKKLYWDKVGEGVASANLKNAPEHIKQQAFKEALSNLPDDFIDEYGHVASGYNSNLLVKNAQQIANKLYAQTVMDTGVLFEKCPWGHDVNTPLKLEKDGTFSISCNTKWSSDVAKHAQPYFPGYEIGLSKSKKKIILTPTAAKGPASAANPSPQFQAAMSGANPASTGANYDPDKGSFSHDHSKDAFDFNGGLDQLLTKQVPNVSHVTLNPEFGGSVVHLQAGTSAKASSETMQALKDKFGNVALTPMPGMKVLVTPKLSEKAKTWAAQQASSVKGAYPGVPEDALVSAIHHGIKTNPVTFSGEGYAAKPKVEHTQVVAFNKAVHGYLIDNGYVPGKAPDYGSIYPHLGGFQHGQIQKNSDGTYSVHATGVKSKQGPKISADLEKAHPGFTVGFSKDGTFTFTPKKKAIATGAAEKMPSTAVSSVDFSDTGSVNSMLQSKGLHWNYTLLNKNGGVDIGLNKGQGEEDAKKIMLALSAAGAPGKSYGYAKNKLGNYVVTVKDDPKASPAAKGGLVGLKGFMANLGQKPASPKSAAVGHLQKLMAGAGSPQMKAKYQKLIDKLGSN